MGKKLFLNIWCYLVYTNFCMQFHVLFTFYVGIKHHSITRQFTDLFTHSLTDVSSVSSFRSLPPPHGPLEGALRPTAGLRHTGSEQLLYMTCSSQIADVCLTLPQRVSSFTHFFSHESNQIIRIYISCKFHGLRERQVHSLPK